MRKSTVILGSVILIVVLGLLLRSRLRGSGGDTAYVTTVQLSGTPGASFTGEYVCDGKRIPISGVLPWSLIASNISSLEIHKARAEDTLTLTARGGGSSVLAPSGSGTRGVRLELAGGWSVQMIR